MSDDSARRYWDRHARNYDRSMAILGGPIPAMVERAQRAVQGSLNVLEVAAGTGLVTIALARSAKHVIATDYSPRMVEQLQSKLDAERISNVECRQADLYSLPFDSGTFDAVVAANVLHLVPDDRLALASLKRVLKSTGCLVVPTYCHDETVLAQVISRVLAVTGFPGRRRFAATKLRGAIESSGFEVRFAETLPGGIPIGYVEAVPLTSRI